MLRDHLDGANKTINKNTESNACGILVSSNIFNKAMLHLAGDKQTQSP